MSTCRSCDREIEWVIFPDSQKKMPIDPYEVDEGNVIALPTTEPDGTRHVKVLKKGETAPANARRYRSHFVTCPNAKQHRRG